MISGKKVLTFSGHRGLYFLGPGAAARTPQGRPWPWRRSTARLAGRPADASIAPHPHTRIQRLVHDEHSSKKTKGAGSTSAAARNKKWWIGCSAAIYGGRARSDRRGSRSCVDDGRHGRGSTACPAGRAAPGSRAVEHGRRRTCQLPCMQMQYWRAMQCKGNVVVVRACDGARPTGTTITSLPWKENLSV